MLSIRRELRHSAIILVTDVIVAKHLWWWGHVRLPMTSRASAYHPGRVDSLLAVAAVDAGCNARNRYQLANDWFEIASPTATANATEAGVLDRHAAQSAAKR